MQRVAIDHLAHQPQTRPFQGFLVVGRRRRLDRTLARGRHQRSTPGTPVPQTLAIAKPRVVGDAGELTVRIIGINTPESGECFGAEATAALDDLVSGIGLRLLSDESDVDRFGRSLRYVETADGVDVGAVLANGFAISRRFEPDVARDETYSELQVGARAVEIGLWAADACGDAIVADGVITIEVEADAPGDDNLNLNGEWVRFTNVTTSPIELADWEVADESASHRYRFGSYTLGPGASVTLYTGCGTDGAGDLFWCKSDSAVWNNSGDTVFLRDPNGNLVAVLAYGESR